MLLVQNTANSCLSLVYSAEYCTPVWYCNAHAHFIDSVLHDALHRVTGCLCPTPTNHQPIFSRINPAELCQLGATLSLAYCGSLDPDHMLHGILSESSDVCQERLRSRHLFVPAAQNLSNNLAGLGFHASEWTNCRWNIDYHENLSRLHAFISITSAKPFRLSLPQTAWVIMKSVVKVIKNNSNTKQNKCNNQNMHCKIILHFKKTK